MKGERIFLAGIVAFTLASCDRTLSEDSKISQVPTTITLEVNTPTPTLKIIVNPDFEVRTPVPTVTPPPASDGYFNGTPFVKK